VIPPDTAYSAPVDPAARLLLLRLWSYARDIDDAPFAWPSTETLARDLGVTERSVRRSLATLLAAGLVWEGTRTLRWKDSGREREIEGWILRAPAMADERVERTTLAEPRTTSAEVRTISSDATSIGSVTEQSHDHTPRARDDESASEAIPTDLGPAPPVTPAESDDDAPPWLWGTEPAPSAAPDPEPGSEPPAASDDVPRKRARAKAAKHGSVEAERVIARLNEIRSAWVAGSNLRNAAEVEGRLRDGYTIDDLLLVLEHKGRRAAMGPGPDRDYFDTISPFRRSNFDGNLSRAQNDAAEPSGRPERGMTPEQARAEAEQRWGQRR
jgi:hypothetical protein